MLKDVTNIKAIRLLTYPVALSHELCHYLTATSLGVEATFDMTETIIPANTPTWKVLLITLAAPLAGLIPCLLMVGLIVLFQKPLFPIIFMPLLILLSWQLTCLQDWLDVGYFVRHGRWQRHAVLLPHQQVDEIGKHRTKRNQEHDNGDNDISSFENFVE